jgi:mono/diheme cytochrome c family protein
VGAARRIARLPLLLLLALPGPGPGPAAQEADGEYVLRISGCTACHTEEGGEPLAGGGPLVTPFGTFYAPNITSHRESGIGAWSPEDLIRALGEGISPEGSHYFPVFPYPSYTGMVPEDVRALHRHLMSTPPVDRPSRAHEVPWYLGFRILNWFWKLFFFERGPFEPDPQRSAGWNRGAYLVEAYAHCGECHSPRRLSGAVDRSRALRGNPHGPEGEVVPNITPEPRTGIGKWSAVDISYYLTTGGDPDGDYAGGLMGTVIDEGLQHLRPVDAEAIAEYLLSVPPAAAVKP